MELIEREVGDTWAWAVVVALDGVASPAFALAVMRVGWKALLWPFHLWTTFRNCLWAIYTLAR